MLVEFDASQADSFQEEKLSPAVVPEKKSAVRIAWRYVIPIAVLHLLTLLVFVPWLFSWSGVVLCLIGSHLFGSGINIGYHRLLTHRSFKCPKWVEYGFVSLALCCLEDNPATWVATHRLHHKESDQEPDPHTPQQGFWWSHMTWLFRKNPEIHNASTYDRVARDILQDRWYFWLQRGANGFLIYVIHALLFALAGFLVGYLSAGTTAAGTQLAASWLVWGAIARTVLVWHMTWSVNSLSHLFGYRNYATREESRNNWFVAAIAAGEGWHNNHHGDPTAVSNWHRWWEFDLTYCIIRGLSFCGLAWDLKTPRHTKANVSQALSE
jgi:fatty-acid desaturase